MAEIEAMPGVQVKLDDSPPVEPDVNDFIDGHHSDDDVGLDGGAEGAGDEAAGDGGLDDDVGLDVGPNHGAGYEAASDGDEEGPGGGDVDDGDGPKDDGDEESHGGGDVDDGEENQGDDEGHQVVPMVRRRTRKTSERITKIKLRKGVYEKYGDGFSSVKPMNLE
ncbi:pheromone-processing carboxypeptidase KEX1-like [Lactuca sativa]|nr:pheromone-processing carboxypeptidase KEX1-like [Lactuca sativa]